MVAKITFNVVVIASSAVKIAFVVTVITFLVADIGVLVSGQDHFCCGWDNIKQNVSSG